MSTETKQHGRDCPKVAHIGDGYLHSADDDCAYDVDGMTYCGRCHGWMGSKVQNRLSTLPAASPETGWRDISTHDKSDEVLGGAWDTLESCKWVWGKAQYYERWQRWVILSNGVEPTHCLPLPAPPAGPEGQ